MQRIAVDNGQCTCVGRASRDIRTILGVSSRRDTESAYSVHRKSPRANVTLKIILFSLEISSDSETLLFRYETRGRVDPRVTKKDQSVLMTLFPWAYSIMTWKNSIASIIYYSQSTTVWSSNDVSTIHILKRIVFFTPSPPVGDEIDFFFPLIFWVSNDILWYWPVRSDPRLQFWENVHVGSKISRYRFKNSK